MKRMIQNKANGMILLNLAVIIACVLAVATAITVPVKSQADNILKEGQAFEHEGLRVTLTGRGVEDASACKEKQSAAYAYIDIMAENVTDMGIVFPVETVGFYSYSGLEGQKTYLGSKPGKGLLPQNAIKAGKSIKGRIYSADPVPLDTNGRIIADIGDGLGVVEITSNTGQYLVK